jgi:hypothetical protein
MKSSKYLTAIQLAKRWGMHRDTLMRWRKANRGPSFYKTPSCVLYPLAEVERYEQANPYLKTNDQP